MSKLENLLWYWVVLECMLKSPTWLARFALVDAPTAKP